MKSCDTPAPTSEGALRDAPGLEFPDWNGMQPHPSRMTFEQAVRWNDEILSLFPLRKLPAELEAARRCDVEFVL
jgi:hypothetical protein